MPTPIDPLLPQIEAFLSRTGMAPATFGKLSAGDPTLVFEMRKGRELRRRTRERIEAWMGSADTDGQKAA